MAMKYRTLKETYKDYVGVFRSHIHGRGLYCTKDIEAGKCRRREGKVFQLALIVFIFFIVFLILNFKVKWLLNMLVN